MEEWGEMRELRNRETLWEEIKEAGDTGVKEARREIEERKEDVKISNNKDDGDLEMKK